MRLVIFAASLMLGGCVSNGAERLHPLEIATSGYSPYVTVTATGSLSHEGNCLIFRDDAHRAAWIPVWPDGTIFNGTSLIFHKPGRADQPFVLDQEILLSGRPLEWRGVPGPRAPLFHRECGGIPFAVADVRSAN